MIHAHRIGCQGTFDAFIRKLLSFHYSSEFPRLEIWMPDMPHTRHCNIMPVVASSILSASFGALAECKATAKGLRLQAVMW